MQRYLEIDRTKSKYVDIERSPNEPFENRTHGLKVKRTVCKTNQQFARSTIFDSFRRLSQTSPKFVEFWRTDLLDFGKRFDANVCNLHAPNCMRHTRSLPLHPLAPSLPLHPLAPHALAPSARARSLCTRSLLHPLAPARSARSRSLPLESRGRVGRFVLLFFAVFVEPFD